MPDADAIADFTILGKELKFTGAGYHDKVTPPTVYGRINV